MAVIKVGAATEVELKERKHRIEDAVRNAKAAVEEGIVARRRRRADPGRPQRVRQAGADGRRGHRCGRSFAVALEEPLKQIAVNAGLEGGVVVEKVKNLPSGQGLNAATGEYVDMFEDRASSTRPRSPARRCRTPRRSPALFLTTEAVIAEKPEKARLPLPRGGGDMDF